MKISFKKSSAIFLTVLALTFCASRVTPAYAAWIFSNKTTAKGLGSNYVEGVFVSGSTVYAATQNGLSISADGGSSFNNKTVNNGLGHNYIFSVFASGSTVYAGTAWGLSISADGGSSFINKTKANGLGNNAVRGVFLSGSTIYAATSSGLSISTNGGISFINKTTADGLGDNMVRGVFANGSTVYAATDGGLSISTNGGISFTNKTTFNGLGSNIVYGVFASGSKVYAATTVGVSISTNGGSSFINRTTAQGLGSNITAGVYASGSTIYVATWNGLSISTDGGVSFINKTNADGLGSISVFGVFASGSAVYAATHGGLSIGKDYLTYHSIDTYDGWVLESTETSKVGGTLNSTAITFRLGDDAANKQYRSILHFNTSYLPDTAVVTKATLKIKRQGLVGTDPFSILGGLQVDIHKPFFGTTTGLAAHDFQALADFSSVATFGATPVSSWYSANLNATGRATINRTGTTQFRLRFATDDNNNSVADYMLLYSGDYIASDRPTLIIEYYLP